MKNIVALIAGLMFALGLVVSGMTQPAKVIGFLDISGNWNPSLAFVMGGALLVTLIAFAVTPRMGKKPWFAQSFELPIKNSLKDVDAKLVAGAALFGMGWGLAGYCPGPAFAALYAGGLDIIIFVAAMLAGMYLAKRKAPHLRARL
jgi:uncharacterized membrane protein YedE/YeeE